MRNLTVLVLIVCILVIPVSYGLTASMGNARMVLRPEVEKGKTTTIDKSILVNNVNDIPIKVIFEPEGNYKKIITMIDNEFELQPTESKHAQFRIELKSGGDYDGKILVSFSPADPEVKDNSVGLASTIVILANGPITEDYYEVMSKENTTPDTEEEVVGIEEEGVIEESEQVSENQTGVSVSMGKPLETVKEPEIVEAGNAGVLVGTLIVIVVIVIGLGIFFIIKKLSK